MAASRFCLAAIASVAVALPAFAVEELPKHRQKPIWDAVPAKPRVAPKRARKVLVWNTPDHLYPKDPHKGYSSPFCSYGMWALGERSGTFEPVVSGDVAMFLPDKIKQFDAIVLNNNSGPWITPTDEQMQRAEFNKHGATKAAVERVLRKSLLDWLKAGGGIVATHYAIAANRHWPEFRELLGGTFIGHPWNEEIGITVEEPSHPLVAAFGGKRFRLADEIYMYGKPYDRSKLRVLMSIDLSRTNMGVKWIRWDQRSDCDFALAWVKSYGKGRIFYTSFGHSAHLYSNPQVMQFYLDAIQFATGDIEAPTAPRPDRPAKSGPGPTPPEVRAARMKARKVPVPSEQQIQQIEAAAPDTAPARPVKARKVLVWGHAWAHLPNPFAEKALEILGKKTGAFEAVVSDDPRLLLGDRLPRFDALVMNNIHEPEPFLPPDFGTLDPEQKAAAKKLDQAIKKSILEFVAGGKARAGKEIPGKGLVGIHAATCALQKWPEYGEMLGGYYGGHITQDVALKLDDPVHPVNACFGSKGWRIHDEVYVSRAPYSRKKLRVLLSLDLSQMADPGKRPDKDYAVSWVRQHGKGRVFYTTLGHCPETYWHPLFLRHVLAGVQFAVGDLAGEAAPSEK